MKGKRSSFGQSILTISSICDYCWVICNYLWFNQLIYNSFMTTYTDVLSALITTVNCVNWSTNFVVTCFLLDDYLFIQLQIYFLLCFFFVLFCFVLIVIVDVVADNLLAFTMLLEEFVIILLLLFAFVLVCYVSLCSISLSLSLSHCVSFFFLFFM